MKKFVILSIIFFSGICVSAYDASDIESSVNMTPKSSFSGYTNNGSRNIYPKLNSVSVDQKRLELMKPKSVHQMGTSSDSRKNLPMQMDSIPNNYDSSNMLHTRGLQDLQNVNMYF